MEETANTYGLYFPIILGSGTPVKPSLEDSIDASLRTLLSWEYRKRNFSYHFGSVLLQLLSSPNSPSVLIQVRRYIVRAIERWEKRISITSVKIDKTDDGELTIYLEAVILETQTIYNFNTSI